MIPLINLPMFLDIFLVQLIMQILLIFFLTFLRTVRSFYNKIKFLQSLVGSQAKFSVYFWLQVAMESMA